MEILRIKACGFLHKQAGILINFLQAIIHGAAIVLQIRNDSYFVIPITCK